MGANCDWDRLHGGAHSSFPSAARATSASLRDLEMEGRRPKHRVALLLDRVQNFQAAAGEQIQVDGQLLIHFAHQRQTLLEPVPRAFHFKPHHFAERRRVAVVGKVVFR